MEFDLGLVFETEAEGLLCNLQGKGHGFERDGKAGGTRLVNGLETGVILASRERCGNSSTGTWAG